MHIFIAIVFFCVCTIFEQLAENTAVKVQNQTEQIKGIDEKLMLADSELDRAGAIIRSMARKMMTDKLIWFMIALVIICLIIIVLRSTGILPDF